VVASRYLLYFFLVRVRKDKEEEGGKRTLMGRGEKREEKGKRREGGRRLQTLEMSLPLFSF